MASCDILILIAMHAEAEMAVEKFNLCAFNLPKITPLPARLWKGSYQNFNIILSTFGQEPTKKYDYVGTQFAAITTWALIKALKPRIIVNAGTAGGFIKEGAKIGDVYINSLGSQYHDRQISLPIYQDFCHKKIESESAKIIAAKIPALKQGLVSTGNSLDTTTQEIARLCQDGAQVKDMEAACIAEIAALFGKEVIALKSITDHLDGVHPSAEEFMRNLKFASTTLTSMLIKVIDLLATSKI